MSGTKTTGAPVRRHTLDARQAPTGVATGALGDISDGESEGRERDIGSREER